MTNIILTGFMGTGKTTVGTLLAQRLDYAFVDTDALIEDRTGLSVSEIFSVQGEAVFRQMEADVAQELASQEGWVVSTGGRLMLDPGNVVALGENGRIFCLVAAPDEIVARVQKDGATRPLLVGGNPRERIEAILAERKEKYGQFEQVITSGKTPEQVTDEIVERLKRHKRIAIE